MNTISIIRPLETFPQGDLEANTKSCQISHQTVRVLFLGNNIHQANIISSEKQSPDFKDTHTLSHTHVMKEHEVVVPYFNSSSFTFYREGKIKNRETEDDEQKKNTRCDS